MSFTKGSDLGVFDSEYDDYDEYFSRPKFRSVTEKPSPKTSKSTTPLANKPRASAESKPLLELTPEDRRYYKHFRKLHGIRYVNLDYVPLDPTLDPPPRRCFSCWERGHMSRACTYPLIALFCRNCGRRDVDIEDCPRCKWAYRRESAKSDIAAALREVTTNARKTRRSNPLDESLLVNNGSVDGDDASRRPLDTIDEWEFESKYDFTTDMLSDVKKLMDAVKHLSVKTQDLLLRQWLSERQKNL